MNQTLITHIAAEVVIVGGITFYFMRKFKQTEEQMRLLDTQLKELQTKVQTADKHIQTLYQMIEGLAEQAAPPPPRRRPAMPVPNAVPESLRNRKHKMKVVPLEEDEDVLELEPMPSSAPPRPTPFNMGSAIFEMMMPGLSGGQASPLDGFFTASPEPVVSKEPAVVIEEEEDDKDIQEELKELGLASNDDSTPKWTIFTFSI